MRKDRKMIIALSALLVMGVTGCGNKDNKSAKAAQVEENVENKDTSAENNTTDTQNQDTENNTADTENQDTNTQDSNTDASTDNTLDADHTAEEGTIYESFDKVIEGLTKDQKYMYTKFDGIDDDVLVVADGTYDNGDGTMVAISCQFFMKNDDGKVVEAGSVDTSDTAYPIAVNGSNIFACGNHFAGRYTLNKDTKKLVLVESGKEQFDDQGNGTYSYMAEGEQEEKPVDDNSKIQAMYDEYSKATPLNFK